MKQLVHKIRHLRSRILLIAQQILRIARPIAKPVIETTSLVDGKLVFSGHVLLNFKAKTSVFVVRKFREERITREFPMTLTLMAPTGVRTWLGVIIGMRRYSFEAVADFPWGDMPSSIYGTAIIIDGLVTSIKTRAAARQVLSDDETQRTYCIFIEPSARVLRIEMYHFGSKEVARLRKMAEEPKNHPLLCLIGEYTNTARDNGRALFEWLRTNTPDVKPIYVIESDNHDNYPVGENGVVAFGSVEHLDACMNTSVCAFSHHRGYVYPYIIHMLAKRRYRSTRTIFLQHGITAMKKSVARHYRRSRVDYSAVCVCSQSERLIFRQYFGYGLGAVFATGFPRYDSLYEKSQVAVAVPAQILFFPTWRNGIEKLTSEEVTQGEFFREWSAAMAAVGDTLGLRRVLVLHPMLTRHTELFRPFVDEIYPATQFQDVLVKSVGLVTDYSSVSFDAIFLNKPAFLFQFDQDDYGLRKDAFIDIDTQLPGQLSLDIESFTAQIKESHDADWPFTLEEQRNLYFDRCDNHNSERVLALIYTLSMTN